MQKMETDNVQSVQLPTGVIKNFKVIIAGILLFLCFFLPWVEIQIFTLNIISYSGWDLAKLIMNLESLSQTYGQPLEADNQFINANISYSLYLIPTVSVLLAYSGFKNNRKLLIYLEVLIVLLAIFFIYMFSFNEEIEMNNLGIGIVGTSGCCLFFLFDFIYRFREIKTSITSNNKEAGTSATNVSMALEKVQDTKGEKLVLDAVQVIGQEPNIENINPNLNAGGTSNLSSIVAGLISRLLLLIFLFCIIYWIYSSFR